ncbi:MAG: DUF4428 domain-containing protein [Spirochaetaceae bacterium]|nr:DUF4428 domain-containing protein [Spirochaetaceae bacterium]
MGLFDKKFCDICGDKIGLLGNKKLKDGNMCKNCQAKLSPFFHERRESTIEEIKAQLEYREKNKEAVAAFRATTTFGDSMKIYIDEAAKKFLVTRSPINKFADANPDVIDFSQVVAFDVSIDEDENEVRYKNSEGEYKSFTPQRYAYSYNFEVKLTVQNPYFSEISFNLNEYAIDNEAETSVDYEDLNGIAPEDYKVPGFGTDKTSNKAEVKNSEEYKKYLKQSEELGAFFGKVKKAEHDNIEAQNKAAEEEQNTVICPYCGAKTKKGAAGICEFCGAPLP